MDFKERINRLKEKLPKSKSGLLIAVGLLGLMLILVSSFDIGSNKNDTSKSASSQVNEDSNSESYTDSLESKLENVISDMLGGTDVTVMITLDSGTEFVYADEIRTDADLTKDQTALKTQQSDKNQKTYVIVKDSEGNERPLIVTEKMPVIRGVVIVCESGETPSVASAVRLAVKSALNIDEGKICIIGRHQ